VQNNVFGNPHSINPSSSLSTNRIEEVRDVVLQFFNASPADYQVVFTKGATGGLKITGETFPWSEGSVFRCVLLFAFMQYCKVL
jgi:molybdenum cofactor sulfurtransferase